MSSEEGYVKFRCIFSEDAPPDAEAVALLNKYRRELYRKGLIGCREGIGYGNLSLRLPDTNKFIISGTKTGCIPYTNEQHYTLVEKFDIAANTVHCRGPVSASSESLTHAALYQADPAIRAVIHVHHAGLWKSLLNKLPTTPATAAYGTADMAFDIIHLYAEGDLPEKKIAIMGGHEEGIISFGASPEEAADILSSYL